jgi:CheY-like chemotaxis protein
MTAALSVLIVDDEAGMRETVADILSACGYEVATATNGEDALNQLRDASFSLVLMDIRMPGRDGISVLREIGGPPPPVVLMTAYAADEHVQAASDAAAFALIHKPVPPQRLLDVVAQATAA